MVYVLAFVVMALVIVGMAIGVINGREPLKGSCGGLAAVGIDGKCEICGGEPNSCDTEEGVAAVEQKEGFYDASGKAPRDSASR